MDQDGKTTLAWVENGEVFNVAGEKIALERNRELFSLEGELLNYRLREAREVRGEGRTPALRRPKNY